MPILVIELKYNEEDNQYNTVELFGGIPKQPIELTEYNIRLAAGDDFLNALYVTLPFLNGYDVNSSFEIKNAIPLFMEKYENTNLNLFHYLNYSRQCSYEFNLGQNIPQNFNNWRAYYVDPIDNKVKLYTTQDYTITLIFNYRRPELL